MKQTLWAAIFAILLVPQISRAEPGTEPGATEVTASEATTSVAEPTETAPPFSWQPLLRQIGVYGGIASGFGTAWYGLGYERGASPIVWGAMGMVLGVGSGTMNAFMANRIGSAIDHWRAGRGVTPLLREVGFLTGYTAAALPAFWIFHQRSGNTFVSSILAGTIPAPAGVPGAAIGQVVGMCIDGFTKMISRR